MSIAIRIKDCIDNHEKYVAIIAALPDKELAKILDLVHIQMRLAEQTKNTGSLELLEIWRTQIIEARICKAENNITDAPGEIELAIAGIETIVAKSDQYQEILNEVSDTTEKHQPKVQMKKDDESQLSLF